MSIITRMLGMDKKIQSLGESHKKELDRIETSHISEIQDLRESLKSDLADEVSGWSKLGGAGHELEEYDRKTLLKQAWNAFCKDPLSRANIKYTTIFVFGKGIEYEIDEPEAKAYIDAFYNYHGIDQLQKKISNELQIFGELFLYIPESKMVTTTKIEESKEYLHGGVIREASKDNTWETPETFDFIPIDPLEITDIETDPYDIRKVIKYKRVYSTTTGMQVTDWIPGGEIQHIMINNATNSLRGRSDLESIVSWIYRYNDFLKNRCLLNKIKQAIFFECIVDGNAADVAAQKALYPHGPKFGTALFHNKAIEWKVVEPKIDARTAEADARMLRQQIAVGAMLPEYMLSEGRGTTYSTGRVQEPAVMQKFVDMQDLWEAEFLILFKHVISLGIKYRQLPAEYEVKTKEGTKKRKMIDVPIRLIFPKLTKDDMLEKAKAMTLLKDLGLSDESILKVGGFDWKTEERLKKREEEKETQETFEGRKFKEDYIEKQMLKNIFWKKVRGEELSKTEENFYKSGMEKIESEEREKYGR